MAVKYTTTLRNAQLDQIDQVLTGQPYLRIYSGTAPTNCSDAATGTLCAQFQLPSPWLAAASNGSVAKSGTWQGTGHADAGAGTNAGYFRIYDSANTTCHIQGSVTATGGGGDMTMNNISIASGQSVEVTSFTVSAGNG